MTKFFRKYRQNLLPNNKFTKYLAYATGEIILIVIGILIALELNINRENQANEASEIEYLKGMLNDLDQDIYELNELLEYDTIQLNSTSLLLNIFIDDEVKADKSFIKAIGRSSVFHAFDGNRIVFEDMKSSGKIHLIESDVLRIALLKHHSKSEKVSRMQSEFVIPQIQELIDDAFGNNIDLNSLVEVFLIPPQWSTEIDSLDLTFFEQDIKSPEVINFANKLSMVKAHLMNNHKDNLNLLYSSKKIKESINNYLALKGVEIRNSVPGHVLSAIKTGDTKTLENVITNESLNDCFFMEHESGNYLVHSITYHSLESLKFFLEKGADIEHVCENKTPLMYAIKYGEFEIVKYLVDQGADIEASNHGKTPLYYSKAYKHPEIEKYLIKKLSELE